MSVTSATGNTRGFTVRDAIYLGVLVVALAANAIFKLDPDVGGYQDRWLTIDKLVHFAIAYAIVILGRLAGARQAVVLGGLLLAAVLFEYTQGFVSWRDIVAGWAGAFFAAAWWLIPERRENPR